MDLRTGVCLLVLHVCLICYWIMVVKGPESFDNYAAHQCVRLRRKFLVRTLAKGLKVESLIRDVSKLMACPYKPNITQRELYRVMFRSSCNATGSMVLTQTNTKLGQNINYETNRELRRIVDENLHNMLPQSAPWGDRGALGRCAVVGSGGILQNSRCGEQIEHSDFIFRFNLAPVNRVDVGWKTDLITINPSQIRTSYRDFQTNPLPLAIKVSEYGNASVLMPPFAYTANTALSLAVHHALHSLRPHQRVVFFNPDYLLAVGRTWRGWGLKEKRLSTGLMIVSTAMELCQEVHLYGFWPFSHDLSEKPLPHHYYDNIGPKIGVHSMPDEFLFLLQLHSQGALQLHLGPCNASP